jgi:hypothetical protein
MLLNYAEAKAELGSLTDADWQRTFGALAIKSRNNRWDIYEASTIDTNFQSFFS